MKENLLTAISKHVYIDKLADIVNKYNNTYHSTIKRKHGDIKPTHTLTLIKKGIRKNINLKLLIMLEYRNIKIFLQNVVFQIGLKKWL